MAHRSLLGARRPAPEPASPRRLQDWLVHPALVLIMAGIVGLAVGMQFVKVNPRLIKAVIAAIMFFVFARYPVYVGVGAFVLLYPFPTAVALGNSNFIFAVMLTAMWLVKVGLRVEPWPRGSLLGTPVFALFAVHILSLIMMPDFMDFREVVLFQQFLLAAVLVFAVMTNTITTPRRLHFLFQVLTVGAVMTNLQALIQFVAPTLRIIPAWYYVSPALGQAAEFGGRIGGVFRSHPLLADSAAMMVILQLFLMTRAAGPWRKGYHLAVAGLATLSLFISVNRGGFVILLFGLLIVGWHLRRDLKFSRIAVSVSVLAITFLIFEQLTAGRYEDEVTLFSRVAGTRFESLMPENRAKVWTYYAGLILQSPILGHGPMIDIIAMEAWPHNAYLFYAYTTGVIGLSIFLWLLLRAILKTRPRGAVSWVHGSYVRGAMLAVHVMLLQFAVGQLRTDHQRGNVFVYLAYILFAQAAIVYRLVQEERRGERALTSRTPP
ncbi:MAG: hypothetical protein GF355_13015 [Candidatus Eisenbacteria bacterium]|nr:hypothetical protein [Candidatus Eisenbacteria bacterium]